MRGSNVRLPLPLIRQNPIYPGQVGGVPGTDNETGLRTNPTGSVFYVDPPYPGASDLRDGTNPTDPLLTIQEAVDQCQDYRGDTIVVGANSGWTYSEAGAYGALFSEAVTLDKHGVTLIGAFGGLGVPWQPAASGGIALTVSGCDCTVEGFAFMGATGAAGGTGIYAEWDGGPLYGENLCVRNCTFDEDVDIAIQLEFAWFCAIHDNFFQNCDEYGIYCAAAEAQGIALSHIYGNSFIDCGTAAIALLGGADDNFIYENRIFNADAATPVAATNEGINLTGGARNMVTDNYLSCAMSGVGPGDYDDFCTAGAGDGWVGNHTMGGLAITNPT